MAVVIIVQAINTTGITLTYLTEGVSIPAHSTITLPNSIVGAFSVDPTVISDILAGNLNLSDSVHTYIDGAAQLFLNSAATALTIVSFASITALNGEVDAQTAGSSAVTFNITGTWVATLVIESTVSDGVWQSIAGFVPATGVQTTITSITSNQFVTVGCSGFTAVRIRASSYTSGTVSITSSVSNYTSYINQGIPASLSSAWPLKITDGTNGPVAVKPPNTAAVVADPALVVAISPTNNSWTGTFNAAGQTTSIVTSGCSTVQYSTLGTFIGQIVTEISYDGGINWFAQATTVTDPTSNLSLVVWGDNAAGAFNNDPWVVNVAGTTNFRLRVVTYTSGSLAIQLVSTPAVSTTTNPANDRWSALTIGALNAASMGSTSGCSTCAVSIVGTWVGIISFQATIDDINFFPVQGYNLSARTSSFTTTVNGNFTIACGGFHVVQAIFTSYSSGSAVVTLEASPGTNPGVTVISPIPASGSGFSFGEVTTAASAQVPVEFTAYTEPTSNSAMTIVSASASDTSAGTGARTVMVTYLDNTGAGPFTTTFTMNGTTPVTAGVSNMCFVEKITVATVGSTGSNVGILTLKTGGAATVGTIGATANQTYWAHHYTPILKTTYISGFDIGTNGSSASQGGIFVLKVSTPTVANTPELQASDFVTLAGGASSVLRSYGSPIQITGPARIRAYVTPQATSSFTTYASFDYIDS